MRKLTRRFHPSRSIFACCCCAALTACDTDTPAVLFETTEVNPTFVCLIPTEQIFDGGVGQDGIPALDFPDVVAANAAPSLIHDTVRVIGIELNGVARAYPLFVLWWHEVVNDTLGGTPLLVSYCPLTGSGLAFDPTIGGAPRIFGVSGLLLENNLIMFDRETESLWNQLLLGAQCGPERGKPLDPLPVIETTWGHWKDLHPTTTVTTHQTGFVRPYGEYPYGDYAQLHNDLTFLPSSQWSRARPPKELVLGVRVGLFSAAYPFGVLDRLGPVGAVNDRLGSMPLLVTWVGAAQTARAFDRRLRGAVFTFEVADASARTFRDRETGSTWNLRGEAISGPLEGERLKPATNAWTLFWFAWSVYYPGTNLFRS